MELQKSLLAAAPMTGLDLHMLIILGIMGVTGLLGGFANYFLRDRAHDGERREWGRYPVLGLVAALTVPLFLNMISSSLIDGARVRPGDYFVFAGFCLIYVVASRRLFENVANRLLLQVDQVRRDVTQLKQAAHESPPVVVPPPRLAEAETAPPARVEPAREALTYADIQILRALAEENHVYGNLAALADKTGLAREVVSQRLTLLKNSGIIETRINDKNVLHWNVAPRGRQTLLDALGGADERKAG